MAEGENADVFMAAADGNLEVKEDKFIEVLETVGKKTGILGGIYRGSEY